MRVLVGKIIMWFLIGAVEKMIEEDARADPAAGSIIIF